MFCSLWHFFLRAHFSSSGRTATPSTVRGCRTKWTITSSVSLGRRLEGGRRADCGLDSAAHTRTLSSALLSLFFSRPLCCRVQTGWACVDPMQSRWATVSSARDAIIRSSGARTTNHGQSAASGFIAVVALTSVALTSFSLSLSVSPSACFFLFLRCRTCATRAWCGLRASADWRRSRRISRVERRRRWRRSRTQRLSHQPPPPPPLLQRPSPSTASLRRPASASNSSNTSSRRERSDNQTNAGPPSSRSEAINSNRCTRDRSPPTDSPNLSDASRAAL